MKKSAASLGLMITARTAVVEIGKGMETMGIQIEESYIVDMCLHNYSLLISGTVSRTKNESFEAATGRGGCTHPPSLGT